MLTSVLVFAHFSWSMLCSFYPFHLRPKLITHAPNPAKCLIVKKIYIMGVKSTAAMLVTVYCEWNPWNQSIYGKKWWNTAWGQHRGIHWLLLSLGGWQTKLLNPLLRPHVTKHTCYSIMPAVLIVSIIVDRCCPMGSLNLQVQLKDNKPISRRKQQHYPGLGLLRNPSIWISHNKQTKRNNGR